MFKFFKLQCAPFLLSWLAEVVVNRSLSPITVCNAVWDVTKIVGSSRSRPRHSWQREITSLLVTPLQYAGASKAVRWVKGRAYMEDRGGARVEGGNSIQPQHWKLVRALDVLCSKTVSFIGYRTYSLSEYWFACSLSLLSFSISVASFSHLFHIHHRCCIY